MGEHGSAVNTGRGEGEEPPMQGNSDIYNSISGEGEILGNTQGEHRYCFLQRGTDTAFSNDV